MTTTISTRSDTITASYPCCGNPCRLRVVREHGVHIDHEVVERRHFCEPQESIGTTWRIEWTRHSRSDHATVYRVTFLDLASNDAEREYGARRVPQRTRSA